MFSKRSIIVLLAGINVALFVTLILASTKLPAALAQSGGGGRAGDYSVVTAKTRGQSFDVVYVLQRSDKKLHAFYPSSAQGDYQYAQFRDLSEDFQ